MLKLEKPIVFFDLETTGTDTAKDKIVQIAMQRIDPDGERTEKKTLINPGQPIPAGATKIHGITDEMVEHAPKFAQLAKGILAFITGADIAAYNGNRFDIPLLMEEFERVGITWPEEGEEPEWVDIYLFEKYLNGHSLGETYKRRTGKELIGAHDAQADVSATVEVLIAQLQEIGEPKSPAEIAALCKVENQVDIAGKIKLVDGVNTWTFGKEKGKAVTNDIQYADWVLRSDFPVETKRQIRKILADAKE